MCQWGRFFLTQILNHERRNTIIEEDKEWLGAQD